MSRKRYTPEQIINAAQSRSGPIAGPVGSGISALKNLPSVKIKV